LQGKIKEEYEKKEEQLKDIDVLIEEREKIEEIPKRI
jgi:hypothetical protein